MTEQATIELTSYPPSLFNIAWATTRQDQRADEKDVVLDFGKHLRDGPCITYIVSLASAHNGRDRNAFCWSYNAFSELPREADFWNEHYAADPPTDFRREHDRVGKRAQSVLDHDGAIWMVLRADLSHRPEIPAEEFGKVRFVSVDEPRPAPGRTAEFEASRQELANAYATAEIEQPVWVYETYCGGQTGGFQIWTPYHDITELDLVPQVRERVNGALGDAGLKRIAEATAASILDSQNQLVSVNPGGSYLPAEVMNADPAFWSATRIIFP